MCDGRISDKDIEKPKDQMNNAAAEKPPCAFRQPLPVHSFLRELTGRVMDGPIYPVGSVVLLTTKEFAVVREIRTESDFQPLVEIISNIYGRRLQRPIRVDLRINETRKIQKVASMPK